MELCRDEFVEMYEQRRLPLQDIADHFGCSRSNITHHRKKWGIAERYKERCRDLTDQKFGRWTVLSKVQHHQRVKWLCECECGNKAEIQPCSLLRQRSTKCRACGYVSTAFVEPVPKFYWTKVLLAAKSRKLSVEVSQEYCRELFDKQQSKCVLTGVELCFGKSVKEFKSGISTASLDRIDSSKGYVEGNVQWIHKIVNYMKMDLTQEEFLGWCKRIADHGKICLG